jgi:hypothetical protein
MFTRACNFVSLLTLTSSLLLGCSGAEDGTNTNRGGAGGGGAIGGRERHPAGHG